MAPTTRSTVNFAAGPSALPTAVLEQVQAELLNYGNTGVSVMELSHRSAEFEAILERAISALRILLGVPANYKVLFMQGGGTLQFAAVPLNLLGALDAPADYIVTGSWSEKAVAEARKYSTNINVAASGKGPNGYTSVPPVAEWRLNPEARYVYYCANETIDGVELDAVPDTKGVPLVVDMSSNILSRPVDVSKFGVIFAGAQKNMGPSGVTVVIIREDLLGRELSMTPTMCSYKVAAANNSLYNTPPSFAIYVLALVAEWIVAQGGLAEMHDRSARKSRLIYDAIESSAGFYRCPVAPEVRSRMNVCFRVYRDGKPDSALETEFLKGAEGRNMIQLKGHRSVGGIRTSLYNAVSVHDAEALAAYMREFCVSKTNGSSA